MTEYPPPTGPHGIDWDELMDAGEELPPAAYVTRTREATMIVREGFPPGSAIDIGLFWCPNCRSQEGYLHVEAVELHVSSGEALRLEWDGSEDLNARVLARPVPGRDEGRRCTVVLPWSCELCGSDGEVLIQQHKGQSMVRLVTRVLRADPAAEEAGEPVDG